MEMSKGGTANELIKEELSVLQRIADHPHIIAVKEILRDN